MMIKVETDGGHTSVSIEGRITEIKSDTVIIVKAIYDAISDKNESCAEDYKGFVEDILPKLAFKTHEEIQGMIHEEIEQSIKELMRGVFCDEAEHKQD